MTALDRVLDTSPLRTRPDFRRLWIGTSVSMLGHQLALVAVLVQVWQLTGNPVWVGAIGLARALPMIAATVIGGALADRFDRRRVLIWSTSGGMTASTLLAAQALAGLDSLAVILALVAAQGLASVGSPARRALIPRLLPREQVAAGVALNHVSFQAAMLGGPALAGLVAAGWGVGACYLINALASGLALYTVVRLPAIPPAGGDGAAGSQVRAMVEGWRFVVRRPVLQGAFLSDLSATVLAMPIALFPMVNEQRFGGDPRTLGLFLSAIAVGGIAAGVTSGAVTRHPRPGQVMLAAAAVWGVALAGFGLAGPLWLVLACLAVAGAADTVSVISRGALVQLATPDTHRGRVSATEHVVGVGGPEIGNFRGGVVAGLTSATFSLVSGGALAVLAVAVIAGRNRPLRRFHTTGSPDGDEPG